MARARHEGGRGGVETGAIAGVDGDQRGRTRRRDFQGVVAMGQRPMIALEPVRRRREFRRRLGVAKRVLRGVAGDALRQHALTAADVDDGRRPFLLVQDIVDRDVRKKRQGGDDGERQRIGHRQGSCGNLVHVSASAGVDGNSLTRKLFTDVKRGRGLGVHRLVRLDVLWMAF